MMDFFAIGDLVNVSAGIVYAACSRGPRIEGVPWLFIKIAQVFAFPFIAGFHLFQSANETRV